MTLRKFFCLLGAIATYSLIFWLSWLVTANEVFCIIVSVVALTIVFITLDEVTDKHRNHGGW